jgi:hypothetical protein
MKMATVVAATTQHTTITPVIKCCEPLSSLSGVAIDDPEGELGVDVA